MHNPDLGSLIVTGASRGIGAATARLAAQRGYSVAVNFHEGQKQARQVVEEILAAGGRAIEIQADVSHESEVVHMFEAAERELGHIKGLVNNAGVTGGFARVEDVSAEAVERVFAVNVTGAILCAREAVRRMSTQRGGSGGAIVEYLFARGADRLPGRVGALCGQQRGNRQLHNWTRAGSRDRRNSCERGGTGIGGNGNSRQEWRPGPTATLDGHNPDG